ncbi:hypothetical protein GCM10027343_12460 [Noviherbaspirillum agri]
MHLLAEESIHIKRPASDVFNYVTDMERFGEWFPGVLSIESANQHQHGQVGKEYLETVSIPLRGERKIKLVVREAEAGRRFVTEGKLSPLMPRMEVTFSPVAVASCQLTWRMYSRNNGGFVRLALLPLARRVMRKRAAAGVKRLKRHLEQSPDDVTTHG